MSAEEIAQRAVGRSGERQHRGKRVGKPPRARAPACSLLRDGLVDPDAVEQGLAGEPARWTPAS